MVRYKFVVLGAGPSGLTVAHALRQHGETSVLVLEKEEQAGGLCRSAIVDGAPLDTGGGHVLDVTRPEVLELLFRFLPRDEWNEFQRESRIHLYDRYIGFPLEANIWQLEPEVVAEFLESIARAGCVHGTPMPEGFEDWIVWKLGERIAQDYMLPYNRKIWSMDLNSLGTYWLNKLPDVSFRQTVLSCLTREPAGSLACHAAFLYPKRYGYGEVWRRIADDLGKTLELGYTIRRIDVESKTINGEIAYQYLVNTIPWHAWPHVAELPPLVREAMRALAHASLDIEYSPDPSPVQAHWIYEPAENVAYHRLICRDNFAAGARGHWRETNSRRRSNGRAPDFHNEYAYPINTRDKRERLNTVLAWSRQNSVVPLGRWGTWEHMNSDVAVSMALKAAREMAG